MNYNALLQQISDHVHSFFVEHAQPALLYHNLPHTAEVVEATKKIGGNYNLNDRDFFIVVTAAWFHDTGYLVNGSSHHEDKSAELAETYLKSIGVGDDDITEIKKCIVSTKMPQRPVSLLEKIICDADLFHLGTSDFKEKSKLLRKEIEALKNIKIDGDEWRQKNLSLLESHEYHTDYCRTLLNKSKADQIEKLKRKQQEKILERASAMSAQSVLAPEKIGEQENPKNISGSGIPPVKTPDNNGAQKKQAANNKKQEKPIRGVETMFRVSSSNHQKLSVMADNKAHIMISVNSIIISVALALVIRKLEDNKNLAVLVMPTLILLGVNVIAIIYAVLATRPKIPNGKFTKEEITNKTTNLLFFGTFYNMSFEDYEDGMQKMMIDSEFLYGSLIRDIYSQGKVLGRKYKLLHKSYNVFMYGIAISVIAYALALLFHIGINL
ncbi:MAG: HD domain-containing protein [Bacteroidetes bacterium]|nr:HD domain-containing protein [Bacteroidota bacterium]